MRIDQFKARIHKFANIKRNIILLSLLIAFALQEEAQTLTDIDGNTYNSITMGTQIWMAENLKVTHYRNGDPIPHVTDNAQWSNLSSGAYCNYASDTNKTTLYNWFTVTDSRNIAPAGWHVPADTEWTTLTAYLGGENVAGGKLELCGFVATGSRNANGGFEYPDYGDWWASTASGTTNGCHRGHPKGLAAIYNISFNKKYGFSVRCINDIGTLVDTKKNSIPTVFSLGQNYPNPFNPSTNISFSVPKHSFVSLKIFDLIGREVATVVSEYISAGNYVRQWNAEGYTSGIYFYRLQAGSFSDTKKLILLR